MHLSHGLRDGLDLGCRVVAPELVLLLLVPGCRGRELGVNGVLTGGARQTCIELIRSLTRCATS